MTNVTAIKTAGLILSFDSNVSDEFIEKAEQASREGKLILGYLPDFNGIVDSLAYYEDDGLCEVEITEEECFCLVYMPVNAEPSYFHAPYSCVEAIYTEMRLKLAKAGLELPEGFNMKRNLCVIEGTYSS